jgi:ABC-type branched-subunit amino acid transport system ATPase component
MDTVLRVTNLESGYFGKPVVHGVSFELAAGSAVTIIGPNGCGKSTLIKTIVGLLNPMAGSIEIRGIEISRWDAPKRACYGMAYVPQEKNVFANMSVRENLIMGIEFMPGKRQRSEFGARLEEVLELFPALANRLSATAGHLSGGQRQMLALAAALMQRPFLLVLDEPSAGLSPNNAAALFENIRAIRDSGVSLLMIEQNVRLGMSVADTGIVMTTGRICLAGPAGSITPESLRLYYLGAAK